MLILDTDVITVIEWSASPVAESIMTRLDEAKDQVATTVVTYEEQMRGWMAYVAKAKSISEQIDAYRKLSRRLNTFCKMPVLDFDEVAATRFQELRKQKLRMSTMDLKIAAIVLSVNGSLVTRNRRDFARVAGLALFDFNA